MKKLLALLLALVMVTLCFAACGTTPEEPEVPEEPETPTEPEEPTFEAVHVEHEDWSDEVKKAINDFVDMWIIIFSLCWRIIGK